MVNLRLDRDETIDIFWSLSVYLLVGISVFLMPSLIQLEKAVLYAKKNAS
jgi:hypothetical protein